MINLGGGGGGLKQVILEAGSRVIFYLAHGGRGVRILPSAFIQNVSFWEALHFKPLITLTFSDYFHSNLITKNILATTNKTIYLYIVVSLMESFCAVLFPTRCRG